MLRLYSVPLGILHIPRIITKFFFLDIGVHRIAAPKKSHPIKFNTNQLSMLGLSEIWRSYGHARKKSVIHGSSEGNVL